MTDAIISDVHANWEALSKVFEDIDRRGIQSVLCLGDVVGYGPDPDLCLDLVRRRCSVYLMGNHEEALIGSPVGFYPLAREALALTRRRLFRPWWKPWRALGYRRLLSSLPRLAHRPQCLLVHGLSLIHISEPTRLLSISYAVFCLKKNKQLRPTTPTDTL